MGVASREIYQNLIQNLSKLFIHGLHGFSRMIYRNYILFDRVSLKKTYKTPLVMAEVYRPAVLPFRPVPKSELLAQPAMTSRF